MPDKAIDLLDDAGAACRLGVVEGEAVGREEVFFVARRTAEVPAADDEGEREGLGRLLTRLTEAVFDQEAAAGRLANAVLCRRLGFDDGERTVGAFLFTGPTGVGKTEMAKTLARVLAAPLLRYDMSEYMERHAVSRLIGSPPGYVGYEQNGRLTEDVFRHPGAVILFDEVEKAHPDVLNILLQVFDYGCLSDNSGRVVDFSHTLVILTSNVGAVGAAIAGRRGLIGMMRRRLGRMRCGGFFRRNCGIVWMRWFLLRLWGRRLLNGLCGMIWRRLGNDWRRGRGFRWLLAAGCGRRWFVMGWRLIWGRGL